MQTQESGSVRSLNLRMLVLSQAELQTQSMSPAWAAYIQVLDQLPAAPQGAHQQKTGIRNRLNMQA